MFITVAGFKGGIGKTTSAVHLACFFAKLDKTLLVDGDPNHSATGWAKRGALPFPVVDIMAAGKHSRNYEHVIIDTAARPDKEELQALADGCDLLILPTCPDALAIDALLQTIDLLETFQGNYRVLLTMVHPPPVKSAEMARESLNGAGLKLFKGEIRRYIAYEKASLLGVPVYESGDRRGRIAWQEYQSIGKEIING
jgi:chromosome partitioning protein